MNAGMWALLTACIWGVVPILEKTGLVKTDPFTGLFFRSMGVILGVLLLAVFFVKPSNIKGVDLRSAALLVLAGFLASFVAQITFYHGLSSGEVSKVVPISGTYPLIAFILGVLVLGEAVTVAKIAGIVLVVAGVVLLR